MVHPHRQCSTYSTRCHRKAKKIKDINHPSHSLFTQLSSRREDVDTFPKEPHVFSPHLLEAEQVITMERALDKINLEIELLEKVHMLLTNSESEVYVIAVVHLSSSRCAERTGKRLPEADESTVSDKLTHRG
ncbi:hypothetical protein J4Q44_G00252640 [Coregonus suidteri]|uniref:Uncharacterized protein n=1 Tax=Coregonus suidteri TaxID=861788 RepID=A0AAN8L5D3_9TELE